jgi:hypothetical protein
MIAALAAAASVSAQSAPKQSEAQIIGTAKIDPSDPRVATVHARYVCSGQGHLWVSVKQTADRTADPRLSQEGSSAISTAWSDSHRNPVTCDGKWHAEKFTVDQVERGTSNMYGPLAKAKRGCSSACSTRRLRPSRSPAWCSPTSTRKVLVAR